MKGFPDFSLDGTVPFVTRRVTARGVRLGGRLYGSDELERERLAAGTATLVVHVAVSPLDPSTALALVPPTARPVALAAAAPGRTAGGPDAARERVP